MSKLVFFKEDGKGNIYDENGDEAMDVVDEKPDPFAIKQLVNLDSYLEQKINTLSDQEQSEESEDITMKLNSGSSKKYMEYTFASRELFFHYKIQHVMSVAAAARKAGVKESTAHAVEMLTSKFEGLEIKKSRMHEFMRDECNLSMKQTTCWPETRTSKENVQKRYEWVVKWNNTDMDFSRNCIFIDEAGFDINMRASRAWAPRGQMAVTTTPTTKASSHTILGAISSVGVVNLSIRIPKQPPKVRKVQGGRKRKNPEAFNEEVPKGTTAGHYMRFIQETLNVLDKYEQMRGFYFIMDNAPIHKQIEDVLNERNRDYKCVFLPPYSPELNPIEQFWALVKRKVRREKLRDTETLQDRIVDAANEVPIEHLRNIIQHSKNQFDNCLNYIPI
ncbi:hypothetical protein G6F53_012586 [Rhizopus delemar]|nr:hypothetical protein G6F53_012586 [Rhizopus delemar]KAG1558112.1 hypothetical protein G6F50_012544 [Rhizopus delemar]